MSLDLAQEIAEHVLTAKSDAPFGVIAPRVYKEYGGAYPWVMQTECLLELGEAPLLDARIRCHRIQTRRAQAVWGDTFRDVERVEADGHSYFTWDESVKRIFNLEGLSLRALRTEHTVPIELRGGRDEKLLRDAGGALKGRLLSQRRPISVLVRLRLEPLGRIYRLRIRLENWSHWHDVSSDPVSALRRSLLSTHMLLQVRDGAFISLRHPPHWAREEAASCNNQNAFAVLAGERGLLLSSPLELDDYPTWSPRMSSLDRRHAALRSFAGGDEQPVER